MRKDVRKPRRKFLNCNICNSNNVEKSLMSPNLINKKSDSLNGKEKMKYDKIKKTISEYQKY